MKSYTPRPANESLKTPDRCASCFWPHFYLPRHSHSSFSLVISRRLPPRSILTAFLLLRLASHIDSRPLQIADLRRIKRPSASALDQGSPILCLQDSSAPSNYVPFQRLLQRAFASPDFVPRLPAAKLLVCPICGDHIPLGGS